MFKELVELDRTVVQRVADKIVENDLSIHMNIGMVRRGIVKVVFEYDDHELLNKLIAEANNEECDWKSN